MSVSLSYFSSSSVADGANVTSIVNSASLITKIQSKGADSYFTSADQIGTVVVKYLHQDSRQEKTIIHVWDGTNFSAQVSWSTDARDGTWTKIVVKTIDKEGAYATDLTSTDIGSGENLTHASHTMTLNLS
jgi:hypothetical protein